MWHHKLPCLGIPGANATEVLTYEHFVGVQELNIIEEPDQGGVNFVRDIKRRLQSLQFTGQARVFRLVDGIKDVADLHCKDPNAFIEQLMRSQITLLQEAVSPSTATSTSSPQRERATEPAPVAVDPAVPQVERSKVIRLSTVTGQRVSWLWPGRLPLGKLTLIDGDPSLGKSSLVLDLAARLSRGSPLPGDEDAGNLQPAGVVLMSAEDGLEDTLQPRLAAAGADMKRIVSLSGIERGQSSRPLELPADIDFLDEVVHDADAKLVIIDPLMAFLGGDYSANSDQHVRRALHPLTQLADRRGTAILIVRHLNKNENVKTALYRGGGSIGIIGAARCGLLVARDPSDSERRVLAVMKSNLAQRPPALLFSVAGADNGASRIVWHGQAELQPELLLSSTAEPEEPHAVSEASEFLRVMLKDRAVLVTEVQRQALVLGISPRTLRRAKVKLGVQSQRQGFPDGEWYWALPADAAA